MARLFAAAMRAGLFCAFVAGCLLSQPAMAAGAYKVVSVDGEPAARKLSVRIDTRQTEKALKELAGALSAKVKTGERIALINFYLPGNELAQDPWATARIAADNLQVNVLGLRAEEEALFRAEAETDARDVVGVWLTSPPALPGKLTILRAQKGRFIAEWHLRSGQKTTDEVTMARVSRGYRYDVVGGDGAYYLATWQGPLQLGDATRTIAYAEKLVIEKKPAPPVANVKDAPKPAIAAAPGTATKDGAPAAGTTQPASAATAAATGVIATPAATTPRVRRAKSSTPGKSRSTVADLMGGSLAR